MIKRRVRLWSINPGILNVPGSRTLLNHKFKLYCMEENTKVPGGTKESLFHKAGEIFENVKEKAGEDTRRFIVEYSTDAINFQTAGEITPVAGDYILKHHILDSRTFLYRIRMEKKDGKFFSTGSFLLGGVDIAPVRLYPTIVTGNTVNLQMYLPVHRMSIISFDGKQVMAKDLGGITGTTQVALPVLGRGQYVVTFYGNGWQSTEKFMIGG